MPGGRQREKERKRERERERKRGRATGCKQNLLMSTQRRQQQRVAQGDLYRSPYECLNYKRILPILLLFTLLCYSSLFSPAFFLLVFFRIVFEACLVFR